MDVDYVISINYNIIVLCFILFRIYKIFHSPIYTYTHKDILKQAHHIPVPKAQVLKRFHIPE